MDWCPIEVCVFQDPRESERFVAIEVGVFGGVFGVCLQNIHRVI